jgi:putative membrane protein
MALWWILGAVLIGVLVWAVIRASRPSSGIPESAEEILRRRYARGELDRETFQRMRDELRAS